MVQNDGHYAVRGHSRSRNFGKNGKTLWKFLCVLYVSTIVYLSFISCTVSEIWRIIGPIFAVNKGCLSLTHSFGVNPFKFRIAKIVLKKPNTSLSLVWCEVYFDTLEPFRYNSRVQRTDRRTDGLYDSIYAALNYVARPKLTLGKITLWWPVLMVKDLLAFTPESWSENGRFSYCCTLIVSCSPCSGPISKSNSRQ